MAEGTMADWDPDYVHFDDNERSHILSLLGELHGKRILDAGCGTGIWTVILTQRGARVWACDSSSDQLQLGHRRAISSGCADAALFQMADVESLPFPDSAFDLLFGSMILHHVDASLAGSELARVLKPGGTAVFHENSARNPLLIFARQHLVGRFGVPKYGMPEEYPLTDAKIVELAKAFDSCSLHFKRLLLFFLVDKYLFRQRIGPISALCRWLDAILYRAFPPIRRYSYHQIIEFHKE